jgi:hypothetical protein
MIAKAAAHQHRDLQSRPVREERLAQNPGTKSVRPSHGQMAARWAAAAPRPYLTDRTIRDAIGGGEWRPENGFVRYSGQGVPASGIGFVRQGSIRDAVRGWRQPKTLFVLCFVRAACLVGSFGMRRTGVEVGNERLGGFVRHGRARRVRGGNGVVWLAAMASFGTILVSQTGQATCEIATEPPGRLE